MPQRSIISTGRVYQPWSLDCGRIYPLYLGSKQMECYVTSLNRKRTSSYAIWIICFLLYYYWILKLWNWVMWKVSLEANICKSNIMWLPLLHTILVWNDTPLKQINTFILQLKPCYFQCSCKQMDITVISSLGQCGLLLCIVMLCWFWYQKHHKVSASRLVSDSFIFV